MKKTFDLIKQIFIDNKEYFIKCTLMSIIAAFILVLAISFVVPASAADDPTESDQVIIPAGSYKFNDVIDTSVNMEIDIPFTFTYNSPDYSTGNYDTITEHSNLLVVRENSFQYGIRDGSSWTSTAFYEGAWKTSYAGLSKSEFLQVLIDNDIPQEVIDNFSITGVDIFGDSVQYITVTADTSLDYTSGTWFLNNTDGSGSVDPEPQQYLIEAGFYKNRGGWNTSVFPAMNDSIDIRYYDQFNDGYEDTEGMIFIIENEIVTIYYGDNAVYTDGWNSYAFENIEIISDIYVDLDFFTAFNAVFASSTQAGNDFDIGYFVGYDQGRSDGYNEGYTQGYLVGSNEDGTFFGNIIEGVLDALDKLVIVGDFSILDIIRTVIGAFVLIFFLKLIAGG